MTGNKDSCHRLCKHIRLLIIAGGLLMLGCQDVGTTWSAEVRSPDGHFVAAAQTQQWGGPGTADDTTTVDLRQVGSSQAPVEILGFSHQYSRMNLEMKWLTPTHLEVAYAPSTKEGDSVSLDFQVVKIAGIDVSVRNLPDQKVKAPQ
jgi:hypothetical protein